MSSPRVRREDVEEWGDESTRVEVQVESPLGGKSASGKKGKGKDVMSTPGSSKEAVATSKLGGRDIETAKERKQKAKPSGTSKPTSTSSSRPSKPTSRSYKEGTNNNTTTEDDKTTRDKQTTKKPSESLNARYEINPDANGGLGYQYDEVVRGKHERSKMCAVDCEDCRAVSLFPHPNLFSLPSKTNSSLRRALSLPPFLVESE